VARNTRTQPVSSHNHQSMQNPTRLRCHSLLRSINDETQCRKNSMANQRPFPLRAFFTNPKFRNSAITRNHPLKKTKALVQSSFTIKTRYCFKTQIYEDRSVRCIRCLRILVQHGRRLAIRSRTSPESIPRRGIPPVCPRLSSFPAEGNR